MGNPTGFLDFDRILPQDRDPVLRVKDWDEVHSQMAVSDIQVQASRCMDCGVPFCMAAESMHGPGIAGCPVNNLIPEWNDLVYRGLWKDALARLLETNNFPEFTGRVCPAPCESSCVLGINAPPVTIKHHEVSIIDRGFEMGWVKPHPPKARTGKTVAVIGSGPAGLACAAQLNTAGHAVTIFERDDRPGGLLMYGIPNMKLEKHVVDRRIQLMKDEGIRFVCNREIGRDVAATQLQRDFDSLVICTGATVPRNLLVKGRNLKGIHFAMEYLTSTTKSLLDSNFEDGRYISGKDKNVVVIGGGDTGTDCVGTALRQGCRHVRQLEIMPQPADQRSANNPWPQYARILNIDYGQEEAIAIQGDDPRSYLMMTKKFVGDEDGNVREIHAVKIKWVRQKDGRMMPVELPGTEEIIPADLVLLAMGFLGPEGGLLDQLGVDKDSRSNARAEYGKYHTNVDGVFAAGDARRGQSLIVWAINEGRGAARTVDTYLVGKSYLPW